MCATEGRRERVQTDGAAPEKGGHACTNPAERVLGRIRREDGEGAREGSPSRSVFGKHHVK